MTDSRRSLPQVDVLARSVDDDAENPMVRDAARHVVDEARRRIERGEDPGNLQERLASRLRSIAPLARVINATGIIAHTNLGRAPQARASLETGATALEIDLSSGKRGGRFMWIEQAICSLCGADAALVVNNNAAGVLLTLAALVGRSTRSASRDEPEDSSARAEVVVSRGELVEIGGGFRVPEVIEAGGARLVEVGTTNRTHLRDYERAVSDATAAILKVHPSNYTVGGFTSEVRVEALVTIRAESSSRPPIVYDLGSGLLDERLPWLGDNIQMPAWLRGEPGARQALEAGSDIVTFSGDKLLGGPQCGIVAGRADLVDQIRSHPLARALRFDRVRASVLQNTLRAYIRRDVCEQVPFWRLATMSATQVHSRADAVATRVGGLVIPTEAAAGAGSTPGQVITSWGVELSSDAGPDATLAGLRRSTPPVIAKIADARVVLDLRSVLPEDDERLTAAAQQALGRG